MKSILPALLTPLLALPLSSQAQLIFATNAGIFERVNGQSLRIDAGSTAGLFPGLSRNGRFLTYSRPDLVTANGSNGLNPSSDLVLFDRATNVRRVVVDNDTTRIGADFDPLSSQVSPDGRVIAYGVRIGPSFGTLQSPTTSLIVANFATGIAISEPLAARNNQLGPTGDTLSAEFRGLSFFPNSNSFVTPVLSLVNLPNSAAADTVSTITRFDRQPNGQ